MKNKILNAFNSFKHNLSIFHFPPLLKVASTVGGCLCITYAFPKPFNQNETKHAQCVQTGSQRD